MTSPSNNRGMTIVALWIQQLNHSIQQLHEVFTRKYMNDKGEGIVTFHLQL